MKRGWADDERRWQERQRARCQAQRRRASKHVGRSCTTAHVAVRRFSVHRCSLPSQAMSAAELLAEIEHETLQSVGYISLEAFATDLMLQFLNVVRCSGEAPFNKSKHNRD